MQSADSQYQIPRRRMLQVIGGVGVGSVVFGRAMVAVAEEQGAVTAETIRQAEWIAGLDLTDEKRELMLEGLNESLDGYDILRKTPLDNAVPPAVAFDPDPNGRTADRRTSEPITMTESAAAVRPSSDEDLAFAPVTELLAVAHAYQQATGFHLRRPPLPAQP